MKIVHSQNGVPIRLTDERWAHIVEGHQEFVGMMDMTLESVRAPQYIYEGKDGELLALREIDKKRFLVVVYKEQSEHEGFIITAFLTSRPVGLSRRKKIWPPRT